MENYSGSPYYDRYSGDTEHRRLGYTRVLAKPGYAEQSAEFNEVQSIARDYTERLGKSLYKDGYIVSGCALNINDKTVTVESGQIFLDGLIREFDGATLAISAVGTERIVANIVTTIVTADNDSSLRDPAQGAENYGLVGADRERQVVALSVISGDSVGSGTEIYHLEDGVVPTETTTTDTNSMFADVLAERTYDENGSYKVSGITIKDRADVPDSDHIRVYVSEGKAYVKGYEVSRPSMTSVLLDQSKTTRTVTSESHYYSSAYTKYTLSNGPVATVTNLTCLVSVVGERKYKQSSGGMDSLTHSPVDSISKVYTKDASGNIDTVFVQNRDYRLYQNQVDWSLTGDTALEPTNGTTYYVDYVYNKSMSSTKDANGVRDFYIENEADSASIVFDNGDRPDENSRMYISYTYTLSRRDLLLLDKDGNIDVIKGTPDKLTSLLTPYNGSEDYLELGYVDVYPTDALSGEVLTGVAEVNNYDSVRFTQENFYTMYKRIGYLEDAIAQLDLEREVTDGEDASEINGYFTDNFTNANKSDLTYSQTVDGETISFTACIDYDTSELTTQADIDSEDLVIDDSNSDDYASYGTIISAPYEYELALKQSYATGTMLVNPYASYGPMCQVVLEPSIDNWVDTAKSEVYNVENKTAYTNKTVVYSHGYWSRSAVYNLKASNYMYSTTKTTTTDNGKTVSYNQTTNVAETIYEYMRTRSVSVVGKAFSNGMENIYMTFNGNPIDLVADTTKGTVAGADKTVDGVTVKTVNATENGTFYATFTVPEKTPCGTVDVSFIGTDSSGDTYTGLATYSANGTLLTTTITNTTTITQHYTVLKEVDNLYSSDPLAQSFILSTTNDRVLMKLGLYFATKSSVRPAIVQVRNMVNGYPGETVYAEVTLDSDSVNIPTDANTPVVTEVKLNQPVYCKANTYYCFVVLSDSNSYRMYYANMGDNLLGTTEALVVNPYATGVMFSSSNASTWTAHQGADLKFELYRSKYTGSGEIIFDNVATSEVTGLFLDVAYEDRNNTGLTWYYKYAKDASSDSDWLPIDTLTYRDLGATTTKISLKAIINTDFSTSPYIDTSRVSLRSFVDKKSATYISTHIGADDFEEPYQALKISYQAAIPSGADHQVYYMDDVNGSWVKLESDDNMTLTTKTVDEEFTQFTWTISKIHKMVEDSSSEGSTFFKIRIDLSTTLAYNRPRIKKLSAIFKYI